MTLVTIGGETFRSGVPVYVNNVAYLVTALEGWDEGAEPEISRASRGGHGQVVTTGRLVAKEITMKGVALARSDEAMWTARTRLPQIFDLVASPGVLVVHEPTAKQCEVYRDGRLAVTKQGHALTFEADLFSPDWRRFSLTDETANTTISAGTLSKTVEVNNPGTAESHPVIEITGPAINPRLALMTTGEELELTGTLTAGAVLTIDFFTQTVLLDGAPADYVATGNVWWTIPPGAHDIRYRVVTSSAAASTAVITFRPAWA